MWCCRIHRYYSSNVLILCGISHANGIEIRRTYYRYWYRSISKSHDISRILDTIPNTTNKQFRTHTRRYPNLPPSWLYTANILLYLVLRFLNPQHPEQAESKCLSKQSNHMGQINLEPRKPQHPSTGHPLVFQLGFGLEFGSSGHNHVFSVFPTVAVYNVYTGTAIHQYYTCC